MNEWSYLYVYLAVTFLELPQYIKDVINSDQMILHFK